MFVGLAVDESIHIQNLVNQLDQERAIVQQLQSEIGIKELAIQNKDLEIQNKDLIIQEKDEEILMLRSALLKKNQN